MNSGWRWISVGLRGPQGLPQVGILYRKADGTEGYGCFCGEKFNSRIELRDHQAKDLKAADPHFRAQFFDPGQQTLERGEV